VPSRKFHHSLVVSVFFSQVVYVWFFWSLAAHPGCFLRNSAVTAHERKPSVHQAKPINSAPDELLLKKPERGCAGSTNAAAPKMSLTGGFPSSPNAQLFGQFSRPARPIGVLGQLSSSAAAVTSSPDAQEHRNQRSNGLNGDDQLNDRNHGNKCNPNRALMAPIHSVPGPTGQEIQHEIILRWGNAWDTRIIAIELVGLATGNSKVRSLMGCLAAMQAMSSITNALGTPTAHPNCFRWLRQRRPDFHAPQIAIRRTGPGTTQHPVHQNAAVNAVNCARVPHPGSSFADASIEVVAAVASNTSHHPRPKLHRWREARGCG
jgi:hypothetical protein